MASRIASIRLAALLTITVALAVTTSARAVDVDEDGIDDALEQTLIDMYRPMLHYDNAENVAPVSVDWYIRHSELIWRFTFPPGGPQEHQDFIVYSNAQLDDPNDPNSPLLILNASGAGFPPSTTTQVPGNVGYRINIFDEFRNGPGLIEPVGMYAHVVQLSDRLIYQHSGDFTRLPPPPANPGDYYLIQYWQFLPFNDFQFTLDIGNHEGDWMWIDVFVERDCPYKLRYIVYHHHGDSSPCGFTILGDEFEPLPTENEPHPLPCSQLNTAPIPQCFLESGSHEWWPVASGGGECEFCVPCLAFAPCCAIGCCKDNPSHNGFLGSLRSQNVLNVGERFAPMSGLEPQLIMHFNGLWGHDHGIPNGPSGGPLRQESPGYPFSPLMVAYVNPTASPWSDVGLGSRYHPFVALADALAESGGVVSGGRVRIAPQSYPGPYTLSRPMRLERDSPTGTVVVGR